MTIKPSIIFFISVVITLFCPGCRQPSGKTNYVTKDDKKLAAWLKFEYYLKEIKADYSRTSNKENYLTDCKYEIKHKIIFPLQTPAYALVHLNDDSVSLKPPKLLTPRQLNKIIDILNDTSTYRWGEIGTPYFDKYITFHSRDGKCVGITDVSYDGQTKSNPGIAKMKDGLLTIKGENAIKRVLESN